MNYRHAYHAGNFCDVLKHTVLCLCLRHLTLKDAPFFVLDTHAGLGLYDIASTESAKTGEAQKGIGRLIGADAPPLPADLAALMAPYLEIVTKLNGDSPSIATYPGSPELARQLTRPQDSLTFCELHTQDVEQLKRTMSADRRVRVLHMDGWLALKALLPPQQRRGLILIDPSFEEKDEMERLAAGFRQAQKRFATGIYLLWYPIKDRRLADRLADSIKATGAPKILQAEIFIRHPRDPLLLNGSGIIVVNPPFTLHEQLAHLLPALTARLREERNAPWSLVVL